METDPTGRARVLAVYMTIGSALVLIVALVMVLLYVSSLQNQVEASLSQQRAGCARGNLIRSQINYNSSVLQSFLSQAASTREQTADHADADSDPVTARINRDAARAYRALLGGFTPLAVVDCENLR